MKTICIGIIGFMVIAQTRGPITPGKEPLKGIVHRAVDLRTCAWVEFKGTPFRAEVGFDRTSNVTVDHPGIATCVEMP